VRFAIFQNVHQRAEIVLEKLTAAAASRQARQNAGIGRRIDYPIGHREHFEVAGNAEIAVNERHS
jgi:hypothetical protein